MLKLAVLGAGSLAASGSTLQFVTEARIAWKDFKVFRLR